MRKLGFWRVNWIKQQVGNPRSFRASGNTVLCPLFPLRANREVKHACPEKGPERVL